MKKFKTKISQNNKKFNKIYKKSKSKKFKTKMSMYNKKQ